MDESSLKEKLSFHCIVRYFLFVTNTVLWIVSIVLIAVGAWARDEKKEYSDLDSLAFDPSILLIVVGCLMFVVTFCGCVGALRENKILLQLFLGFLTVIFILELVTGFVAFFFVDKTRSKVKEATHNVIMRYRNDPDLQNAIDGIQKGLKCCGGFSYHDWELNEHFNCSANTVQACGVPFSCCREDQINTHCGFAVRKEKLETEASQAIYTNGCIDSLTDWINSNLHIVGGLAFGFAVIQPLDEDIFRVSDLRTSENSWNKEKSTVFQSNERGLLIGCCLSGLCPLLGILGAFNVIRVIDEVFKSQNTETELNFTL